jgi:hypothetical protein
MPVKCKILRCRRLYLTATDPPSVAALLPRRKWPDNHNQHPAQVYAEQFPRNHETIDSQGIRSLNQSQIMHSIWQLMVSDQRVLDLSFK